MTEHNVPQSRPEFLLTEMDWLRTAIGDAVVKLGRARRDETDFRHGELAQAQRDYETVYAEETNTAWADYAGEKRIISGSNDSQRRAQLEAYLQESPTVQAADAALSRAQAVVAELHDATQAALDALQALYAQAELVRGAAALQVAMLTYSSVATPEVVLDGPLADDLYKASDDAAAE